VALCIALLGAESSGKSTLAMSLSQRIPTLSGLRCAWVPEHLRAWCDEQGRTPHAHEQQAIAMAQSQAIEAAAAAHEVVVCDTTALQTAAYSALIFGDSSLLATALAWQREHIELTLLCSPDLHWQSDAQRDGAHMQAPVHQWLRQALLDSGLRFCPVSGAGEARTEAALAACAPALLHRLKQARPDTKRGAFTRWGNASHPERNESARWQCSCCDDPASEQALLALRGQPRPD
jgi:nicotinamide riboside kinase